MLFRSEIRRREHFHQSFDGVVLPGGESTVQGKLMREEKLLEPLRRAVQEGLPAFGTCAGLILLAKKISNDGNAYLGTMDITVKRNAYGRQIGSFRSELEVKEIGNFPAVYRICGKGRENPRGVRRKSRCGAAGTYARYRISSRTHR